MSSEFTAVHRRRSQKSYVKVDGLEKGIEADENDNLPSQLQVPRRRSSQEPFRRRSHEKTQEYMPVTTSSKDEIDDDISSSPPDIVDQVTIKDYCSVLQQYPYFRAYLLSHLCQHIGDWFVHIASLLVVEQLGKPDHLGGSLAKMVLANRLVKPIFCPVGGLLADHMDRRYLMIVLDLTAGVAVLGYLLALKYESLHLMYAVTVVRSAISSTYYPITTGIVPMLVPDPRDLKIAVTLNSFAWSSMAIVGGLIVGAATATIGLRACYIIDSVSYFVSAVTVLFGIHGSFNVMMRDREGPADDGITTTQQFRPMAAIGDAVTPLRQIWKYLATCGFGLCTLMKASIGATCAPESIIGVLYTKVEGDEAQSSLRMGYLFSTIGFGCFLGPLVMNLFTDGQRPITLQGAFLAALGLLVLGWILISFAGTLSTFLVGQLVRTMGTGIAWTNSNLILQTLSDESILGRMLAVDYTAYQISEAMIAAVSGEIHDAGVDKEGLALFGAAIGTTMLVLWGSYHYVLQGGAAQPSFNGGTENGETQGGVELSVVGGVFTIEDHDHEEEIKVIPKIAAV